MSELEVTSDLQCQNRKGLGSGVQPVLTYEEPKA